MACDDMLLTCDDMLMTWDGLVSAYGWHCCMWFGIDNIVLPTNGDVFTVKHCFIFSVMRWKFTMSLLFPVTY